MHLCLIPSHDESWGPSFNWRAEQWRDFILTSQWRLKELLLCRAHQPTHSLHHVRGSPPPRAPAPGWSCPVCCCHAWVPPSPLPSLLSWDGAVKPICSLMCSGCWGYTELQKNAKSCLLCSVGTELSLGSSPQISNNISLAQVEPERQKQDGLLVVCLAGERLPELQDARSPGFRPSSRGGQAWSLASSQTPSLTSSLTDSLSSVLATQNGTWGSSSRICRKETEGLSNWGQAEHTSSLVPVFTVGTFPDSDDV